MPKEGHLALISQSGAIAAGMVDWAAEKSIGFSGLVSIGEQLDVDIADLLDHFALDYKTTRDPALCRVDHRRAQVHVGGARRGARQAGGGGEVRPDGGGRQGGRDPYRRARRRGRGLRRRVPPRRHAAGLRSARAVRLRRNARPDHRAARQAAGDRHQWRRHRRAGGRSPGRTRRHPGVDLGADHEAAQRRAAGDLVGIEPDRSGRRCRRRALWRGAGGAARRSGERRRAGDERADRDLRRLRDRRHGGADRQREPRGALAGQTGADGVDRRRRQRPRGCSTPRRSPTIPTEDDAVRGFMHLVQYREAVAALSEVPPSLPKDFAPDVETARRIVDAAVAEGRRWLDPLEIQRTVRGLSDSAAAGAGRRRRPTRRSPMPRRCSRRA